VAPVMAPAMEFLNPLVLALHPKMGVVLKTRAEMALVVDKAAGRKQVELFCKYKRLLGLINVSEVFFTPGVGLRLPKFLQCKLRKSCLIF